MKPSQIEFKPMIVPTLKGIDNLDNISEDLFPLYYIPFFKGIPLYIKDGRIRINGTEELVKNYELMEELKFFRTLTHKIGFVIHITFQSTSNKGNTVYNELLLPYGKLPNNYKLQFTDIVIKHPKSLIKMKLEQRDANLWFLEESLKREKIEKPHWYFNRAYIAPTSKELTELIEPRLIYDADVSGVTLHKPKSSYHCGFSKEEVDSVNIDLLKEEEFTVIYIRQVNVLLGKKKVDIASEIIVSKGSSIYTMDATILDFNTRKLIWDTRNFIYGKPILIEVLTIPTTTTPILKRILRIGETI